MYLAKVDIQRASRVHDSFLRRGAGGFMTGSTTTLWPLLPKTEHQRTDTQHIVSVCAEVVRGLVSGADRNVLFQGGFLNLPLVA
eukprot:7743338-Pyramimonas_sp.AAC.1